MLRCVAALLVSLVTGACQPTPADPLAEVRALVDNLVAAVEAGTPQVILSHVAFEFQTDDGLTYPDVQSVALEYLIPDVTVGSRLESVEVGAGDASEEVRARVRVRFARGARLSRRSLPPPPGSVVYAFELWFRRIEGEWQAVRGRYRRVEEDAS
jgi:hypothetical protein